MSLGQARDSEIGKRDGAEVHKCAKVRVESGDLFTMKGKMQQHYEHPIPVEPGFGGVRI